MKKTLLNCLLAAAVLALGACTEKEKIETTTDTTPEVPQHNSLYQTTWAGTAQQTVTLPIIGDITVTVDNTVEFLDDSTASSYISFDAASMYSTDSTIACTYTWEDPNGVLTAEANAQMSIAFHKVNANTINITITKDDITAMWPTMGLVSGYLPESFSIDLIKQE